MILNSAGDSESSNNIDCARPDPLQPSMASAQTTFARQLKEHLESRDVPPTTWPHKTKAGHRGKTDQGSTHKTRMRLQHRKIYRKSFNYSTKKKKKIQNHAWRSY